MHTRIFFGRFIILMCVIPIIQKLSLVKRYWCIAVRCKSLQSYSHFLETSISLKSKRLKIKNEIDNVYIEHGYTLLLKLLNLFVVIFHTFCNLFCLSQGFNFMPDFVLFMRRYFIACMFRISN